MSFFLVGNAYSKTALTIWQKGKIIVQSHHDSPIMKALISYQGTVYVCYAHVDEINCYFPKDNLIKTEDYKPEDYQ